MCPFKTNKYLPAPGSFARYCVVILLCCHHLCNGQTGNINFHHLTVDNGLPSGFVHCIYQDVNSFMWFGTEAGLCRFDGVKCRAYQGDANDSSSLRGNHVYTINEDGLRRPCILTERGLNIYNRAADNFSFYPFPQAPSTFSSHVEWRLTKITDGNILIEAGDAPFLLFNIQTNKYTAIPYAAAINYKCKVAAANGYWPAVFGPGRRGIRVWENNKPFAEKFIVFKTTSVHDTVYVNAFAPVKNSVIWAATSKGLAQYNMQTGASVFYTPPGHNSIAFISILCNGGNVWLGSDKDGIWQFDMATKKFTNAYTHSDINSKSPQSDSPIDLLFCDRQGNIWMGAFAHGIDYFNTAEQKFVTYLGDKEAKQTGRDNFIRALAQDARGNVWAGTYTGQVYRFGEDKNIAATYKMDNNGRPFKSIEKILVDGKKRLWVLDDGLSYYDTASDKFVRIFAAEAQPFAHDIFLAADKTLYFLNHEYAIAALSDSAGQFAVTTTNIKNVLSNLSVSLADDKGRVYVNDVNGSILVYAHGINDYMQQQVLPVHGYIKACYNNNGVLWIATSSGLVELNTQTFSYRIYTVKNGLPENTVYSVLPGSAHCLWLSTNKGISRFDTLQQRFSNYNTDDGLQGNEFNTNAYALCRDSAIWFGGIHGLNIFYPASIKADTAPPPLQITAINVNDGPYFGAGVYAANAVLQLPYEQRTVSFNFTGIEYLRPSAVMLQYRLVGIDRDWITTINPGFARYANLPAGSYTLQLRAAGNTGNWTNEIKTLQIFIATPYYQTWWFIALVGMGVVALLYGWYYYRVQQIKKMQMVRNRIARDLHDDIGSSISSIRIMTDIVKETADKNTVRSGELIKKIGNESQQVMDSIRDIVWAINPDNDLLGNMFIRMQEYAAEMLEGRNIEYSFEAPEHLHSIKLSMQKRRDLYLIFKEAINNMAKYSQGACAEIKIYRTLNKLVLSIKDDGVGFNMDSVKHGNGLKNMQVRATQLKGALTIQSAVLKGTTIKLEIPVT